MPLIVVYPVHEADHLVAAGVPGHHLQLGRPGRLRRGRRARSAGRRCCSTPPASSGPWATTRIYAHQDKEDDALIGVKSTALLLGTATPRWLLGFYGLTLALLLAAGALAGKGAAVLRSRWCRSAGCCCGRLAACASTIRADCLARFRANRDVGLARVRGARPRLPGLTAADHGLADRTI